jgi:hypothetical protein
MLCALRSTRVELPFKLGTDEVKLFLIQKVKVIKADLINNHYW